VYAFAAPAKTSSHNIGGEERTENRESTVKMDVPFRRMVGLTALGLATGALLRLIYQSLQKEKHKADGNENR
jgi:hypothetical protein